MDAADRESVPGKNPAVSGGKSIEEKRKELYIQKMEIFGIQKIIMILLSYYMMASKYGLDW